MSRFAQLFDSENIDNAPSGRDEHLKADEFTLLFVDDEEGVLNALRRIFMDENYRIVTALNAEKALEILEKEPVNLVVSDHRMPGMTGAELLRVIKERWPDTIRIMLTGHADVNSIMGAVKDGAVYKFITKPWNDEDLRLTVSLALQQYMLARENRQLKELTSKQQIKIKHSAGLFDDQQQAFGNALLKSGAVKAEQLAQAMTAKKPDDFLGDTLVSIGAITESGIVKALQKEVGTEFIDLKEVQVPQAVTTFLPRDLCERNHMVPVRLDNRQLTVAVADPCNLMRLDNLALMTGLKVVPLLAVSSDILALIRKAHGERDAQGPTDNATDLEPLDEIDVMIEEEDNDINVNELIDSSEVPPVIRIVNAVISEAIRYQASDIHIEPKTKHSVVRYRIDGLLHNKISIPLELHPAVISRIKILSKMDISERRRPQDGRITVKSGTRLVDLRVSTMPTLNGEKVVLRILDKTAAIKRLDELGVLPDAMRKIQTISKRPQGVIITTGPTGSGKTTMLYSMLSAMLESSKNFETIEEPVEYFVDDANQVSVREKIGLSFASVLRATLRQDPDVILVGEMRDFETADVAFKAALTGHMVLSTLHTNNSVASITRLIDMGIQPYILASALEGIIAQRLVRKVCESCSQQIDPDPELIRLLRIPEGSLSEGIRKGSGCAACNQTGYRGRMGIFEVFVMNDDFRHLICSGYREAELFQQARIGGMRILLEDGIEKVRMGQTTLEELVRVVGPRMVSERQCSGCDRLIEARFIFCPHCGSMRNNICLKCAAPLEDGWSICPLCGTRVTQEHPLVTDFQ